MHHDRVYVEPEIPRRNQNVVVKYNGLLAQSGADSIWLHYGYDGWKQAQTVPMNHEFDRFTCQVAARGDSELNFCFKDSADHWDNNSSWNWSCPIR